MKSKHRKHRTAIPRAFTLLELVVASVLLALMLAGVTLVFRALLNDNIHRSARSQPISQLAAGLLRADLANSRAYRAGSRHLDLIGYTLRDNAMGSSLLLPAIVRYEVVETPLGSVLWRNQVEQNANSTRRIIWKGVAALKFSTSYVDTLTTPLPENLDTLARRSNEAQPWQILPPSVELWLSDHRGETLCKISVPGARE